MNGVVPQVVEGGGRERSELVSDLLAHADDNMILAQRLGELISRGPELEIDIAVANIALDHLGVARALYTHAGHLEGEGRDEDELAMMRSEREFANLLIVEQPNGDFAHTVVRQMLFDAYQLQLWEKMSASSDKEVAGIAAKALKEASYHFRFSSGWVERLGDGTAVSHDRAQDALDSLWAFTGEMFEESESLRPEWERLVAGVVAEATLSPPDDPFQRTGGRTGLHSEHLGFILAEMQSMQRSFPGLQW